MRNFRSEVFNALGEIAFKNEMLDALEYFKKKFWENEPEDEEE